MHYHLKTLVCTDNPTHNALHKFNPTTRDFIFLDQTEKEEWPAPDPTHGSQGSWNHGLCKDWCRNGLPPEDTKLSTWNLLNMIQWDRASSNEWANVWSEEKRLRPISFSITMLKDQMKKSTLTDIRSMIEWGQQRWSTAISRTVRRSAVSCPKDSQISVPSLLLRRQPSPGLELWSAHGSCTKWCQSLLWLNILLAGNWIRRCWKPSHLPDHKPPLSTERQRHMCSPLLGAKPSWHLG